MCDVVCAAVRLRDLANKYCCCQTVCSLFLLISRQYVTVAPLRGKSNNGKNIFLYERLRNVSLPCEIFYKSIFFSPTDPKFEYFLALLELKLVVHPSLFLFSLWVVCDGSAPTLSSGPGHRRGRDRGLWWSGPLNPKVCVCECVCVCVCV